MCVGIHEFEYGKLRMLTLFPSQVVLNSFGSRKTTHFLILFSSIVRLTLSAEEDCVVRKQSAGFRIVRVCSEPVQKALLPL